jgi:hypothetical protein
MSVDLKNAFRLSFVTGETELPIPAVSEILARLRSGPVWDVASIAPDNDQFPLLHVEWHEGHGFVIQCYEDEQAWSDFLLTWCSLRASYDRNQSWGTGARTMATRVVCS